MHIPCQYYSTNAPHKIPVFIIPLTLQTQNLSVLFCQCSTHIPCHYYSTNSPHSFRHYYSSIAPHTFLCSIILPVIPTISRSILFSQWSETFPDIIILLMLQTHSLSLLDFLSSTPIPCHYYSTNVPHLFPVIVILLMLHTHSLSLLFYQCSTSVPCQYYSTNAPHPFLFV